ncbi:hypothetical protein N9I42_00310 [Porticoccaceae bacterium]|nr:hypothetical protein [Porticoccaceae bacterium]
MKPAELTQTISDTFPKLRKSERKVADLVLKEPLSIINMRIVDLAKKAEVSEPTVVRFLSRSRLSWVSRFQASTGTATGIQPQLWQDCGYRNRLDP